MKFNDTMNKWATYAKLCRYISIFYWKELAYTFQVQKKLRAWENLKWSFSSKCFTAGDRHIRIISSTTVVFNENVTLCFSDNAYLLFFFFQIKYLKTVLICLIATSQTEMHISKVSFALEK